MLKKVIASAKRINTFINSPNVRKTIKGSAIVFEHALPFIEKPTWWNATRMAFGLSRAFFDETEMWVESYFDGDGWMQPYSNEFNAIIVDVLSQYDCEIVKSTGGDSSKSVVKIVTIDGIKFGWLFLTELRRSATVYTRSEHVHAAREIIKRLLWEKFSDKPIIMKRKRESFVDSSVVAFEIDTSFKPLPSAQATKYVNYLRRAFDAGVHRAMMLYGPPGTGKSTMARTLISDLGLKSFRVRIEDLGHIENSALFEAINIFKPDALILDDFDRAHNQAALLEALESLRKNLKLVVMTVNSKESLDPALLRPERVDELEFVDKMDDDVIKQELGEFIDGFETVKSWPIAFIREYVIQRRLKTPEEAALSVINLAKRAHELRNYRTEKDDVDVMVDNVNDSIKSNVDSTTPGMKSISQTEWANLVTDAAIKFRAKKKKEKKGSSVI